MINKFASYLLQNYHKCQIHICIQNQFKVNGKTKTVHEKKNSHTSLFFPLIFCKTK